MTDKSLTKTVGDIANLDDLAKSDEYLTIVNHQPPREHVHDHPLAKGVKYIPIGIIETMLTKLFRNWNVEVLREGQLLNSVYVTVRLNYLHPITKQWEHHDGVGAAPIKTDKGENASNMAAIKNDAIMTGLPAAKSFAIKDAAEHIGRAFGRDINRKDTLAFKASASQDGETTGPDGEVMASDKQNLYISQMLGQLGISLETQRGYINERFGVDNPLTAEAAEFVIKELKDELKVTPNRTV